MVPFVELSKIRLPIRGDGRVDALQLAPPSALRITFSGAATTNNMLGDRGSTQSRDAPNDLTISIWLYAFTTSLETSGIPLLMAVQVAPWSVLFRTPSGLVAA